MRFLGSTLALGWVVLGFGCNGEAETTPLPASSGVTSGSTGGGAGSTSTGASAGSAGSTSTGAGGATSSTSDGSGGGQTCSVCTCDCAEDVVENLSTQGMCNWLNGQSSDDAGHTCGQGRAGGPTFSNCVATDIIKPCV